MATVKKTQAGAKQTKAKCLIKNLDTGSEVWAHFNPTELSVEKSVPWNQHDSSKGDNPILEFTKAEPMTLSLELLFDTYESRENVHTKYVGKLQQYTLVMGGKHADKKRPPMCAFVWGSKLPNFIGVIESLSTKYTMFFRDGTPCRATCSIKMKQADKLTKADDKAAPTSESYTEQQRQQSAQGTTVQQGDEMRADKHGKDHRRVLSDNNSEDGRLPRGQPATFGTRG